MRRECHICHMSRHICDARDETSYVTDVTLVMCIGYATYATLYGV